MTENVSLHSSQDTLLIIACGIVSGMASMLVYARLAPQGRLLELKLQSAELQRRMANFDGELSAAMAMARENFRLSLRRVGVALVPSLWSGLPVLFALLVVHEQFVAFFVSTAVAALATKLLFRIA
jgi:hypothetical protein